MGFYILVDGHHTALEATTIRKARTEIKKKIKPCDYNRGEGCESFFETVQIFKTYKNKHAKFMETIKVWVDLKS